MSKGGGEKAVKLLRKRKKLLPRERIALIVDKGTTPMELSAHGASNISPQRHVIDIYQTCVYLHTRRGVTTGIRPYARCHATLKVSVSAIWRGTTRPRGAPTRGALALEPPSVHIYYPEKVVVISVLPHVRKI